MTDCIPPFRSIAHIRSDFPDKFGAPRQSRLVNDLHAEIIFEPPYRNRDALRGLDGYSHLWLIWLFSRSIRSEWSPTVRPPRLGGKHPGRRVRNPFPVSPESDRPVVRATGSN